MFFCVAMLLVALPDIASAAIGVWYVDDAAPSGVWGSATRRQEPMFDGASSECKVVAFYPDSNFFALTGETLMMAFVL